MTKFENECYEALKRLKDAAIEDNKIRINKETVAAEAGKKPGAIRLAKNPELCKAIEKVEADRRIGLLTVSESEQVKYREILDQYEVRTDELKKSEQELKKKIEKQTEVIVNLLHEINELEDDLECCKDDLDSANNRIGILMEKIQPKSV